MGMDSAKPTFQRLAEAQSEILQVWEARARQQIQAAHQKSSLALIDSLPRFLEFLSTALDPKFLSQNATDNNSVSLDHGVQRALIGQYDINQVMSEFEIFQKAIIEVLESSGPVSLEELKVISNSIQSASKESVLSFVDTLDRRKQESELQFELLVSEVQDYAIFMLDPGGHVKSWNEGAKHIKQYDADEIVGQYYGVLYRPEDLKENKPDLNLKLALEQGRHEEQWWRRRKDGSLFWADVTITTMRDRYGKHVGFSKVIRDLTEKRRVETELRSAKEAAETANDLKSAFLANMSHEIRTPLGVILGFTEMLKDPQADDDEREQCFQVIERNGKVLTRLIEDILDLSKIEAGKMEIENIDLSIRHLLSDISGYFEIQARDKGINYRTHIDADFPDYIRTDPVRLRQILNNLIGNAIKFTSQGSVDVKVHYRKSESSESLVELIVTDTGTGIPDSQRDRLFKPFSQADNSTTRRFGGTGLGLALSRRIANELGGDIQLGDCSHGKGCSFVVKIEDRRVQIREKNNRLLRSLGYGEELDHSRDSVATLDGKQILLAEDGKDNQVLIERILSKAGAFIEIASNGKEALEKVSRGKYDLILMDVQMPVLDGHEATRQLRAQGFQKPILGLTAHGLREQKDESLKAGCNDCLTIPVDQADLLNKIARYLTGSYVAEH